MRNIFTVLVLLLSVPGLTERADAQSSAPGASGTAGFTTQQEAYLERMRNLIEELKHSNAGEQRKEIAKLLRQASEEYRTTNPRKALTPGEIAARKQAVEDTLKKDPYQWEMYQLRQGRAKAASQEVRQNYDTRIHELGSRHAAEEEAKLTPAQRAAARERQANNTMLRSELKPLLEQLHAAKTDWERKTIHSQILVTLKKYQ